MGVTFRVGETPRVYVERIDITGQHDRPATRSSAANSASPKAMRSTRFRVKRSQDRIQSLGFFQENLEIKQTEGSAPDRVVLGVDVEEKATGELQLSAGYSSLEKFIVSFSIAQRNFMGKGQELNAGVNYSSYSKSVELGFTEPYLFDKHILLGGDIYRRDYNSFNFVGNSGTRPIRRPVRAAGCALVSRSPNTSRSARATRWSLTISRSTRVHSSRIPTLSPTRMALAR